MKRIAENIAKEPKNVAYRQIKRHGKTFMRNIVEPKGALELFVEASAHNPAQSLAPSLSTYPSALSKHTR